MTFTRTGPTSSSEWIDVSAYKMADFQVRFRGITGSSFRSYMAIKDFAVGEPLALPAESPVIFGQPQSQTVFNDEAVYFSVVAQAYPSPTYQRQKDGVDIPGATQAVLFVSSAALSGTSRLEPDSLCRTRRAAC